MATLIYTTLISQIKTIFEGISGIKKVYSYPESKIEKYPAVIFAPVNFENSFETNQENFKIYRFSAVMLAQANQKNIEELSDTIIPKRVDEVLEAFDAGFSLNPVDGHRSWAKIDSGNWGAEEEQNGHVIWVEFNIEIKLSTTN